MARSAWGGIAAIVSANSTLAANASGSMRETSPICSASMASTRRLVNNSSMAVETPTVRGKSFEVPKSGPTAIRANAVVKLAFAPAMRISHASASPSPPPAATPLTAAIVGCGSRYRERAALDIVHPVREPRNVGGRDAVVCEVRSRAERRARSGQYDYARVLILSKAAEHLGQRREEIRVQCIELLRAVEHHQRHSFRHALHPNRRLVSHDRHPTR